MDKTLQLAPEGVPEEAPREPRKAEPNPQFSKQLIAAAFGMWLDARGGVRLGYTLRQKLGPGLGMITERLRELDLSAALPAGPPQGDLADSAAFAMANDSGPTPQLRNANLWAAALEAYLLRIPAVPLGTVLTTFGFAKIGRGVRLAAIHYLEPWSAFAAPRQNAISLMGWSFPVIVRPWLPTEHHSASRQDGNCWVKFFDDEGVKRPGMLTARHAVKPKRSKLHGVVNLDVTRTAPPGELYYKSEKMDAAVVAVDENEWGGSVRTPHSTVVGYKPVRLLTGSGTIDADIVEHQGFTGATIPGQRGQEPLNPVYLFLNHCGAAGDSGCLILDVEREEDGWARPYLVYLGVENLKVGGVTGYGLLIEQANKVWGLECYMSSKP